ncbi:MAG: 30S ribosomal protein S12 methylthiotransferase RimO [bacterium]
MTNTRTAALPAPSVGLISLGCAKNLVDTEHMAAVLRSKGLQLARSPETADIVLINTCGFIGDAKRESLDAIRRACAFKRAGGCRAVFVAGCLVQRYQRELQASLPEVDGFLGLDALDRVGDLARRLAAGERGLYDVPAVASRLFAPRANRIVMTGGPFAYLKISEGCNHRCGFCAIPAIRGVQRSRSIASVVREARALLRAGVRELTLVSQDTTAYGSDRSDGAALPELVRALDKLDGDFWVRLLYGYPSLVSEELLETLAGSRHAVRYLDLPIQHSHPEILRAMGRADSTRAVARLGPRLRAALPGVTLRTTCLVGYPGETEEHIVHLLDYVRDADFDHLGVFTFSREDTTRAWSLPGHVPAALARERRARVLAAQCETMRRKAAGRIGKTDVVLLEQPPRTPKSAWRGRASGQAPEVDGATRVRRVPDGARPGDFVNVRYTPAAGVDRSAVALGII